MGAFLLSGGKKGKRFALPNAEIMIHQPSGGAQGQAMRFRLQQKTYSSYKEESHDEILAKNIGKLLEVIQQDTERDNFMSAERGERVRSDRRSKQNH